MSLEPRASRHEPWALSHEPWTITHWKWINEWIIQLYIVVSKFWSCKLPMFQSFKVPKLQSFKIQKCQRFKVPKFQNANISKTRTNQCFEYPPLHNFKSGTSVSTHIKFWNSYIFKYHILETIWYSGVFWNTSVYNRGVNVHQMVEIRKFQKMQLTSRQ